MKDETIEALDFFVQVLTSAIRTALPDAPEKVRDVEHAGKELRNRLAEEESP